MADEPEYVGQKDESTGVGDAGGIPYTYEHVEEPPEPPAEVYQVTSRIMFVERPIHKNVYFVEADRLAEFLMNPAQEEIVDVRPTTYEEAEHRMAEYRGESP